MPAVFPLSDPVCPFCFFLVTSGPSSCSQCYSCRTKKFVSFTTFCLVTVWLCLGWCILVGISNFCLLALEPAKGCDIRLQDTFITVCDLDLVQVMLRQWWMSPDKHQKALQRYIWKIEMMHWVLLIWSKMSLWSWIRQTYLMHLPCITDGTGRSAYMLLTNSQKILSRATFRWDKEGSESSRNWHRIKTEVI